MAASFPVTFPSALSVTGTQTLQDVGHTDNLHVKDRDEIIAAQTKLGLGSSVASGTTALLGTGGTQSAWGQITNAYIAGTAAIAVTKLAAGSPGSVLRTNSGGTIAWGQTQPGDIATGTKGYALVAGTSGGIYEPISRKNLLINGDFRIVQRGSNVIGVDDTYQAADRWYTLQDTGTGPSVRSDNASVASPAGGGQYSDICISGGGSNKFGRMQIVESQDMFHLRGGTVSLGFNLYTTSGISDVRAAILTWGGTADSVTSDPVSNWGSSGGTVTFGVTNWTSDYVSGNLRTADNTWARIKIEGVSISSGANNIAVVIWNNDTSHTVNVDSYSVNDVQLERGAICTEFDRRPLAQELQMCQRYYTKTFAQATTPAQNSGSEVGALAYYCYVTGSVTSSVIWRFPAVMRSSPTLTFYNPAAANTKWRNSSDGADSGTPDVVALGDASVTIYNPQVAGDGQGERLVLHASASAEL